MITYTNISSVQDKAYITLSKIHSKQLEYSTKVPSKSSEIKGLLEALRIHDKEKDLKQNACLAQVTEKEPRYPLIALQQAICASNNTADTKHFIHDETGSFANALKKIQRSQKSFPTITEELTARMSGESLGDFSERKVDDYLEVSTKTW